MNPTFVEQRNPYLGAAPRAWLRLRFLDPNNAPVELTLIADTGCPYAVIIDVFALSQLTRLSAHPVNSNFGPMTSGWARLSMPAFGIDRDVLCHGSPTIGTAVAIDDPSFMGLVGLPILRLGEYGGNATDFWFRYPPTSTPTSQP
ncbi:MAG: hypothetical protein J0I06_01595 [Planctomycetes bacterium]|nr:hypothetical protein [Planctomycetota bacterium]